MQTKLDMLHINIKNDSKTLAKTWYRRYFYFDNQAFLSLSNKMYFSLPADYHAMLHFHKIILISKIGVMLFFLTWSVPVKLK